MEELLNKNIFDDRELVKHSPDFTPKHVVLRMQMRSNMVKDTHLHSKIKSDGWQRKTIKRQKGSFKIGKEIAKIRNGFQKMNLKNQIMLKNAVKYVDTLKSEHFMNGFNDELNALAPEEETYFKDISEMNLTLRNNNYFKLNDKPQKRIKPSNFVRNSKINLTISDNKNKVYGDDEIAVESMLKVECKMLKSTSSSFNLAKVEKEENGITLAENDIKQSDIPVPADETMSKSTTDKDVNDLQTLLIMLAISPHSNNESNSPKEFVSEHTNKRSNKTEDLHVMNLEPQYDIVQNNNINDFMKIIPMKIELNDKQKEIVKKYAEKWTAYVAKKKQLVAKQREETLNTFFAKLSKKKMSANTPETPIKKARLLAQDYTKYRHRYQMQKHIIALQKAKLEEQSRIIEELKYNRIIEASKISVDTMREEVRKTYNEIDKQLKPKLKCLTNELKVVIEEPSLILHCLKVPQFLQRMEKRAREREEKHAMIRERRQQMEEERIRLKQQEELAKAQMDKDEKVKRMNELKDKRRREKIESIRIKQHAERMRALNVMADLHYEKTLKTKYGIKPFRILVEIKRDNIEKAKAHYRFQVKKNVFFNWMWYTEDMWYERNFKAHDFHRKKILKRCFDAFKQDHQNFVVKKQVADDYYDLYVTNLAFRTFRAAIEIVKKENEAKYQMAILYHSSNLLFRTFCCWRTLPALNELKREQEARKARWREKVLQVVPDYTPPED